MCWILSVDAELYSVYSVYMIVSLLDLIWRISAGAGYVLMSSSPKSLGNHRRSRTEQLTAIVCSCSATPLLLFPLLIPFKTNAGSLQQLLYFLLLRFGCLRTAQSTSLSLSHLPLICNNKNTRLQQLHWLTCPITSSSGSQLLTPLYL